MLKRLFLYAWTQDISIFQQGDISARKYFSKEKLNALNKSRRGVPADRSMYSFNIP